jgi:hypothetical protein
MRDAIVIRTTRGASAQVALASKSIAFFYSEFFDGIQLNKDSLNNVLVSCPADKCQASRMGQVSIALLLQLR